MGVEGRGEYGRGVVLFGVEGKGVNTDRITGMNDVSTRNRKPTCIWKLCKKRSRRYLEVFILTKTATIYQFVVSISPSVLYCLC